MRGGAAHLPLEYRTRVAKKGSEWKYMGDVHTVRLMVRGQHRAQRRELAEQAGISRLLELKEPRGMVLG